MGNNGVKGIILVAILVVLSFLIGSQISGSRMVSLGIVGASAGLFILIYLGARSWWLLLLAPVLAPFIPKRLPIGFDYALAPALLVFWAVLNLMGHARFKWKTLWGMDIPALGFMFYTLINFYLHPSSFYLLDDFLDIDSETIGGKEYFLCLLGFIGYITVSQIPLKYKDTATVIKWSFYLSLAGCLFSIFKKVVFHTGGPDDMDMEEQATGTRFTLLLPIGVFTACYIYAAFPFLKIIRTPFYTGAALVACVCVALSGWRNRIIDFAFRLFAIAILKRELTLFICLGVLAYGSLLFLSNEKLLNNLPYGIQRSLCAIPGVHVREDIERNASGSSDWRVVMWRWALDARTGYIRDYTWGDGFGDNKADMKRDLTATMRNQVRGGDQTYFAQHGVWHSGWISSMHRLGIVGLVIIVLLQLTCVFYFFRFTFLLWKVDRKTAVFFAVLAADSVSGVVRYHLSAGSPESIYRRMIFYATLKIYFCSAKEQFPHLAKLSTGPYVPMLIQELKQQPDSQTTEAG